MRIARILAVVVVGIAFISGCQSDTPIAIPVVAKQQAKVAAIGGAIAYPDGLTVKTSAITSFVPSEDALGFDEGEKAIKMTVIITNDTKEQFNAPMVSTSLTYGGTGQVAELMVDTRQKVSPNFVQILQPGKTGTVVAGFVVPEVFSGDVQVQVLFGSAQYDPAIFSGSIK